MSGRIKILRAVSSSHTYVARFHGIDYDFEHTFVLPSDRTNTTLVAARYVDRVLGYPQPVGCVTIESVKKKDPPLNEKMSDVAGSIWCAVYYLNGLVHIRKFVVERYVIPNRQAVAEYYVDKYSRFPKPSFCIADEELNIFNAEDN